MKSIKLGDIAKEINAELLDISKYDTLINNANTLINANSKEVSFLSNKKYATELKDTSALAIITDKVCSEYNGLYLISKNPQLAWCKCVSLFKDKRDIFLKNSISPKSDIHSSVTIPNSTTVSAFVSIGKNCSIGEKCFIHPGVVIEENCKIKSNTIIHPNAVIHYNSTIGKNCYIGANTVIGGDGFGFAKNGDKYLKIPQIGNVIIKNNVEIHANTTIDRGAMNDTVIEDGVIVDNLVQIAHNCHIGENTAIAAHAGLAGSTILGNRVVIAGQAGLGGHLTLGDDSFLSAQAGINKSYLDGKISLSGTPAQETRSQRKSDAISRKLPELLNEIKKIKKEIIELKGNNE